jgi:hypothetical protein
MDYKKEFDDRWMKMKQSRIEAEQVRRAALGSLQRLDRALSTARDDMFSVIGIGPPNAIRIEKTG